jgi:flagellar hook capping protein FlgD/WD40 repeat protein
MNGMKRLLSVVAILVIAASLLPVKGQAGVRGAFDFISNGDQLIRGKFSPALRGAPAAGAGTAASPRLERWLAFCTLSSVVGSESTGEIWLYRNIDQAFARGLLAVPLQRDESALISYIDPAWSKDGKWLAFVKTDNNVSFGTIYIQQYDTSTGTDGSVALGSPSLIADGGSTIHHRHPAFNGAGTQIAYDSDAFGPSIDLWTVNITLDATAHTVAVNEASRTRHQLGLEVDPASINILNSKAEFKPSYSPDGTKLVYVTNRYGPFQIQILTPTADGLGEVVTPAETNPALVTHDNPSYSSDGASLYYDAPSSEDPANPQDIWKLDLATGQKCGIFVDLAGDVDPSVSQYDNVTSDNIHYNYFVFISQAGGFGVQIWRGEYVQTCVPALPMAVTISPSQVDLNKCQETTLDCPGDTIYAAHMSFPAQTIAAGYVCRAANQGGPAKEGMRMRRSIIASPTMLGLPARSTPDFGDCTNMDMAALLGLGPGETIPCFDPEPDPDLCFGVNCIFGNIGNYDVVVDTVANINHLTNTYWNRRSINARIIALGLVNKYVPLTVRAYSNRIGRQFIGFGYIKLSKKNLAGSTVALEQNYPNPFNPSTKINFAVDKPGNIDVRVFNTRGELVRTLANQWFPQGMHTVSWDGRTQGGGHAPSGIYYIRANGLGSTDVIKAVLAK